MTTHILSLTYAPKIPLVKSGECTQTIRLHNPDRPKKVGDKLILHTWAGKPYRTKWDWRLETGISETHLLDFKGCPFDRIRPYLDGEYITFEQGSELAFLDGIAPATGWELIATLLTLNGLAVIDGTTWDVIRWPKPTIGRVE